MYVFQFCIAGIYGYGRTWEDFGLVMKGIEETYGTSTEKRFIVYVHNLSFEHQFMRRYLTDYCGGYDMFAVKKRTPLVVRCHNGIEFRCSYKLTNMSLETACKKEPGQKYFKASGDLDYRIIRTPETALTRTEWGYCIADVACLYDLIANRLKNEYDTLGTIPLTSTGYVRRKMRKACKEYPGYREDYFLATQISYPVYKLLKEAGRGGDTHANRYLTGRVLKDCHSYDVQSSYPAQILLQKYPMTKFVPYGEVSSWKEFRELLATKACLFRAAFRGLTVDKKEPMPYISVSKLTERSGKLTADNGRLITVPYCRMTLTDVDWEIIERQYTWDEGQCYITDMYIADYGMLPEPIRKTTLEWFSDKCRIKYDKGKENDREKKEFIDLIYTKKKNQLNGIFGMMYTDPVREIIEEGNGDWKRTENPTKEEIEAYEQESLAKYYKSRNSFLCYAWGVWTTAHARKWLDNLRVCAESVRENASAYCDTDSLKGQGFPHGKIEELNSKIIGLCREKGAYYEYMGETYYPGVYEWETENNPYLEFKTLGAKKYCYRDREGLHLTVSGVAKYGKGDKKGGAEELGTMDNFVPGFIFKESAGLTLYYNDTGKEEIEVEGVRIETADNIGMVESTYTLGIDSDYKKLIEQMQKGIYTSTY